MKPYLLAALVAAGLTAASASHAAELKVLAAEVIEPAIAELAPQFERATGHKLKIEYGFAVEQNKRVQGGEAFDVVIFPTPLVKQPATSALLTTQSQILRVGQGVAVRKGASKPDIGSPEAFKKALLDAKSVTFVPTGTSGTQTLKVFERLGIINEMKAKTKPQEPATVAAAVAKGDADLALFLNHLLIGAPGVDYVGPYPGDLQQYLGFTAGVGVKATDAEAAKALVNFLTTPAAAALIKAKGMEPG